ncbi:hypothetical protein GLOIN_2v1475175 [Rhizophagus clarus]|uniref:Uncharacterized protein n=1 Tax=Rhizophagus clarus TaxID=94130 RepID=A0A8H3KZV7_9GLOM|nr:hypothetical protein GLOIN_2v1475175 [Rhizophagus clarus]
MLSTLNKTDHCSSDKLYQVEAYSRTLVFRNENYLVMVGRYNCIISGIKDLIFSLKHEEKERLPRIANSLNGLMNEIKIIKSKSEFIMNENFNMSKNKLA